MRHSGHGRQVCQYGMLHARCRCIEGAQVEIRVQCDRPAEHSTGTLDDPPEEHHAAESPPPSQS
jgi:hypothetical protein